MDFKESINIIANVLKLAGTEIDISDYDGLIVKQLTVSNTLGDREHTKQTHIAITGEQMEMFPYLRSDSYFENKDADFKKYFILRVPVTLFKSNIDYLNNQNKILFDIDKKKLYMSVLRSKRNDDSEQVQASLLETDDPDFIKFRRSIKESDYLIFLKKNKKLEYEAFGIKGNENYLKKNFKNMNNTFKKLKTETPVDIDSSKIQRNNSKYTLPEFKDDKGQVFQHNRIIFGAPGTGKSYLLNQEKNFLLSKYHGESERVTFYPSYSYANFVGTYKPTMKNKQKSDISYKFVPGPFMRLYSKALKNPNRPYLLIVEEINRALVSDVFGDIFQLLDRDENNRSEYSIEASEDIKNYLVTELGGDINEYNQIKIPSNMYIWATMNSSDEGVFPIDTAFKRRWEFENIDINSNEDKISNVKVALGKNSSKKIVKWNELRKAINDDLSSYNLNEDKLLGPFFLSLKLFKNIDNDNNLINSSEFINAFKNKVIMYLYEDAAKYMRSKLFSGPKVDFSKYSAVCQAFEEKGIDIFSEQIRNSLKDYSPKIDSNSEDSV